MLPSSSKNARSCFNIFFEIFGFFTNIICQLNVMIGNSMNTGCFVKPFIRTETEYFIHQCLNLPKQDLITIVINTTVGLNFSVKHKMSNKKYQFISPTFWLDNDSSRNTLSLSNPNIKIVNSFCVFFEDSFISFL